MTLAERLHDAEVRSVGAYHQRTMLAQQEALLRQQAMQADLELARLDGEVRVLQALIASEQGPK